MVSSIPIYEEFWNRSTWHIDRIPTCTNTLDRSEPGSNSNEDLLNASQSSRIGISSSDAI